MIKSGNRSKATQIRKAGIEERRYHIHKITLILSVAIMIILVPHSIQLGSAQGQPTVDPKSTLRTDQINRLMTIEEAKPSRGIAEAPIAVSGDNNIYVTWWSNKTGNDEVMFKASTDGGKTFGDKMNLSNSLKSNSQNAQIAAAGSSVYVTWWERNATSNEPVMRVSNDNGKTFGETVKLSAN
jgi:hypothetical protein